jgi:hypothetical protein
MSPDVVRLLLEHGADPQATIPASAGAAASSNNAAPDKESAGQKPGQPKQRSLEPDASTWQMGSWLKEDAGILAGGHALHMATRAHSMVDAKHPQVRTAMYVSPSCAWFCMPSVASCCLSAYQVVPTVWPHKHPPCRRWRSFACCWPTAPS